MKTEVVEKTISHPLEDAFGITPNTTIVESTEIVPSELVESPSYDDKDVEIESKFEEIYEIALMSAQALNGEIELVEGKFKARMGEVSATHLTVALSAAREQALLKQHKDKLLAKSPTGPKTLNQNVILTDRNDLLRMFAKQSVGQ